MNEDFKCVIGIADQQSISKAARQLHVSQSALSQRLNRLEKRVGAALFDRTVMPLRLTEAGAVYLRYARKAVAAENRMRRDVDGVLGRRGRRLRVAVGAPYGDLLLGPCVLSFYEAHRGCTVEFVNVDTRSKLDRLFLEEQVDFAAMIPFEPDTDFFSTEILCHDQLLVAASKKIRAPQLRRALERDMPADDIPRPAGTASRRPPIALPSSRACRSSSRHAASATTS